MNPTFTQEDCFQYLVAESIGIEPFIEAAKQGKTLKVKLGIDPTSNDIHLGRSIPVWRLRAFQELGHEIHLIIGDFTGQVGDTSDKVSERPMLDESVVSENMARYEEQLWMILNPDRRDQVRFHRNSEWLGNLSLGKLSHLADAFSVNQFIKRELVSKRLEDGSRVSLREMLYPLMQGYDSVMINADIELGGTDQRFNLLAGRTLQEQAGQPAQGIIMNTIVSGLDGRKMSSSWGNGISLLDSPADKFGKTMTLRDDLMGEYLAVFPSSVRPFSEDELAKRMSSENPRDLKMQIAWSLVALYHGDEEADRTKQAYISQFSENQLPEDIEEKSRADTADGETPTVMSVLVRAGFASSNGDARRLIEQGGVRMNQEIVTDPFQSLPDGEILLQAGKRRFIRILP